MLHDLAVLETEEIRQCPTGCSGHEDEVRVRCNNVTFGDDALYVEAEFRVLVAKPLHESDEGRGTNACSLMTFPFWV